MEASVGRGSGLADPLLCLQPDANASRTAFSGRVLYRRLVHSPNPM
jgi:hypothetical protein